MRSSATLSNTSEIGFSFGAVLGIVADQYRTLMEAILEAIQNGLDVNSTKIVVNINQKTRNVHIQDNGDGASKAHMDRCLREIGKSQKTRGKLGQFGIGVVASFGKCKRFSFTSHPRGNVGDCHRWVFDCAALRKAKKETSVPAPRVSGHSQWWHSELFIESYTKSQLRSALDFDKFCTAIYDRYGSAMLKNKCTIYVRLTAPNGTFQSTELEPMDFRGRPLDVVTYDSPECGKTTFRMFTVDQETAKKQKGRKKKGQGVRVKDSTGYTLPITEKVFPGGLLKKKDVDIFRTGHFEGEIIFSSKVQLDPSRKFFSEEDATIEAAEHVEKWLNEVGRPLVDRMEDEQSSARYRDLGNQSMKVIDRFLKENQKLASLIRTFKWGTQGIGHTPTSNKKNGAAPGTRSNAGGAGKKRSGGGGGGGGGKSSNRKPKAKKKDTPLVVNNPKGNPRIRSRHDSTGLSYDYVKGGSDLWKFDRDTGTIYINIIHPTWVAHDRLEGSGPDVRDLLICQLQERITLHVLLSLKLADDLGADLEDILTFYAHEFEDHHQFLSTQGDKIADRGRYRMNRGKKKKKKSNANTKEVA